MAQYDVKATPSTETPLEAHGLTPLVWRMTTPTSGIASADDILVATIPAGWMVVDASLTVSATLGADATVQLRIGTTAINVASTAATAGRSRMTVADTPTSAARELNILVGGAAITAAAVLTVEATLVEASVYGILPA